MGKTFAEKVLAKAAGVPQASAGEVLDVYPDMTMSHAASWRCIRTLERMGTDKLFDVNRIAMVMDHTSPAHDVKVAADQRLCREFAEAHGIKRFYDVDAGIAHVVLIESGDIRPGMVLIGTDSHSTIYGALGAAGTGVGFSEVTATWVTGYLWMRVPESMKVVIDGPLAGGTSAKDVMLKLVGQMTANGATYRSIEFSGSHAQSLSISERMTLCNMSMELGCKFAYCAPDEMTREFLAERGVLPGRYAEIFPDGDATYAETIHIDGTSLTPQIACPDQTDNVCPIDQVKGIKVDQVFIGSCTNAKYEDLAIAASILNGHKVAHGVRLIVTPASKAILKRIIEDGIYQVLLDAGALITNPGCGGCAGDGAYMADGEVTLSTANRNFKGRMGSYQSQIFLGSPATAALTAITGVISDPREAL